MIKKRDYNYTKLNKFDFNPPIRGRKDLLIAPLIIISITLMSMIFYKIIENKIITSFLWGILIFISGLIINRIWSKKKMKVDPKHLTKDRNDNVKRSGLGIILITLGFIGCMIAIASIVNLEKMLTITQIKIYATISILACVLFMFIGFRILRGDLFYLKICHKDGLKLKFLNSYTRYEDKSIWTTQYYCCPKNHILIEKKKWLTR